MRGRGSRKRSISAIPVQTTAPAASDGDAVERRARAAHLLAGVTPRLGLDRAVQGGRGRRAGGKGGFPTPRVRERAGGVQFRMLRITQQSSPAGAKSYYTTGSDYYREGPELAGVWGGHGAARLGLEGAVTKRAFDRLCDNEHPATGERLTGRTRTGRTVGYDFTFSAPKSVSLVHALSGDDRILGAFRAAVDETMRDIEAEMQARVRVGGADTDRVTGNAVWATFVHRTARPVDGLPDPHLHAHCFTFNATFDEIAGGWRAGQFRDLKRDAPYFQAAFRARLAHRLHELGYQLDTAKGDFELTGVPDELTRAFARRTALIEEIARARGITDPAQKAALGGSTREHKDETLDWEALRAAWRARLAPPDAAGLDAVVARARERAARGPCAVGSGGERAAVDHAILHAFERASVVPERALVTRALEYGVGAVTLDGVARELAARRLPGRTVEGRRLVTTPEVLSEEQRVLAFARDGRGRLAPLVGYDRPVSRAWLSAEQQRAVRHLWESPDRVLLVRGAAGTGKTALLQEAVEGIEACGHPVVALAPSAEASRGVLRREGFAGADTVARFLRDPELRERARNGVVLIDEAGLLGARSMARVFRAVEELGARAVLVGDAAQHASVERGTVFKLLQERAGVPTAEVTGVRRQEHDGYRDAVKALAAGRIGEGFDALDRLGWVLELPDGERHRRVAADYVKYASERVKGRAAEALVVAPTHAEGRAVTDEIRCALKASGALAREERVFPVWVPGHRTEAERRDPRTYAPGEMVRFHTAAPGFASGARLIVGADAPVPVEHADRFEVFRPSELALAVGDRIRVTANGTTKDKQHRLNTGAVYCVAGFTPSGDVKLDNGWVLDKSWGHWNHGYVVTSHASQGRTADRVLVVQGAESFGASSREQFYVSASRARSGVTVYTDDKGALREAVGRSDPRMSASDLVRPGRRGSAERLKKHLAFRHRSATFAGLHPAPEPGRLASHPDRSEVTRER